MKVGVVLPMAEVDGPGETPGWPTVRSFALAAEAAGLDSVWVFDHFFHAPLGGPVEGMHEGWTILSAVAAVTDRVEVGSLVMCTSFRTPGLLAKMAATADEVSDGRLILGLGAGWHDPEYMAFGIPMDHRVDRFEETLRIVRPLLSGAHVTYDGRFHALRDAVLAPAPARRIPILVAGEGPRILHLAAEHADAWNTAWYGAPDERLASRFVAFDVALEATGRDPSSVQRTVGVRVCAPGVSPDEDDEAFAGSVDDLARVLDGYAAVGADHLIVGLEPLDESTLEHLRAALERRRG